MELKKCFLCDGIRWWQYNFLLICFNAAVKYLAGDIIMLVEVAVGIMSLCGNQETFCPMRT